MPPSLLKRTDIAAYTFDEDGGRRYIFEEWQEFDLPVEGVYALDGPNQAGKSVLIRLLMGALPPLVNRSSTSSYLQLGPNQPTIRNVADAVRNGLVAVFQDDRLIPSMTIREQILVRHGSPRWRHYARWAWSQLQDTMGLKNARALLPDSAIQDNLSKAADDFSPDKEILQKAVRLLDSYRTDSGMDYGDILSKYPRQLSGGATAVARLLLAQLHSHIKVLFLDEALAGVQGDVWPALVRSLLRWRVDNHVAIVVVTHNRDEMSLWQPIESYLVKDGALQRSSVKGYRRRHQGVPSRNGFFHVFEAPYITPWIDTFTGPFVVFIDSSVNGYAPTTDLLEFLRRHGSVHEILVDVSEEGKVWADYQSLTLKCLSVLPRPGGVIVCIGGGVLLNLAGFVGATVHRGLVPMVMVPTTVMSIADVAIGSKTALNVIIGDSGQCLKHPIGAYANPAAVVFDKRFLNSLAIPELRVGLSECLKHALLHSEPLLSKVVTLISQANPSPAECYEVAVEVSGIKAGFLAQDPYEKGIARTLLYGHLHAHSLERATGFSVSHGCAVFWGILLDLKLAGAPELYRQVLDAARIGDVLPDNSQLAALSKVSLEAAYQADTHWDVTCYDVIALPTPGYYHPLAGRVLLTRNVRWSEVFRAISDVRNDLAVIV